MPRPLWQKGQSGNPGGRPKELRDLTQLARVKTKEMLDVLIKVASTGKSESAKVQAATAVLERGWGKPLQTVDANVNFVDSLSDVEQRALASALVALATNTGEDAGGATDAYH